MNDTSWRQGRSHTCQLQLGSPGWLDQRTSCTKTTFIINKATSINAWPVSILYKNESWLLSIYNICASERIDIEWYRSEWPKGEFHSRKITSPSPVQAIATSWSYEWSLGYIMDKANVLMISHRPPSWPSTNDYQNQNHHHRHPHLSQPYGTSPSNTMKHNWHAPWHAANRPRYRRWAKGNDASNHFWWAKLVIENPVFEVLRKPFPGTSRSTTMEFTGCP